MSTKYEINEEFFSGSQASIFIGDVWVDEITDWQCSLGANSQPIYGYGETFFSHAAQGRVLVQGSFSVNFKEPNYLFAILARYRKYNNLNIDRHATTGGTKISGRVETFGRDSIPTDLTTGFNRDIDRRINESLRYEDKRKTLDDFFYQSNDGSKKFNNTNRSGLAQGEVSGVVNNAIRDGNTLSTLDDRLTNDFAVPLFDIKIGYGAAIGPDTIGEQIVGVKLVGKGRTIFANGQPIKETYSFFAQNLV